MAAISTAVMPQWPTRPAREGFAVPTRHASIGTQETEIK
jgi:hypothetical protein